MRVSLLARACLSTLQLSSALVPNAQPAHYAAGGVGQAQGSSDLAQLPQLPPTQLALLARAAAAKNHASDTGQVWPFSRWRSSSGTPPAAPASEEANPGPNFARKDAEAAEVLGPQSAAEAASVAQEPSTRFAEQVQSLPGRLLPAAQWIPFPAVVPATLASGVPRTVARALGRDEFSPQQPYEADQAAAPQLERAAAVPHQPYLGEQAVVPLMQAEQQPEQLQYIWPDRYAPVMDQPHEAAEQYARAEPEQPQQPLPEFEQSLPQQAAEQWAQAAEQYARQAAAQHARSDPAQPQQPRPEFDQSLSQQAAEQWAQAAEQNARQAAGQHARADPAQPQQPRPEFDQSLSQQAYEAMRAAAAADQFGRAGQPVMPQPYGETQGPPGQVGQPQQRRQPVRDQRGQASRQIQQVQQPQIPQQQQQQQQQWPGGASSQGQEDAGAALREALLKFDAARTADAAQAALQAGAINASGMTSMHSGNYAASYGNSRILQKAQMEESIRALKNVMRDVIVSRPPGNQMQSSEQNFKALGAAPNVLLAGLQQIEHSMLRGAPPQAITQQLEVLAEQARQLTVRAQQLQVEEQSYEKLYTGLSAAMTTLRGSMETPAS